MEYLRSVGSNPLHPALVHVPLVMYPLSYILLTLGFYNWSTIPSIFNWAYLFNTVALVATVPAALTGYAQYQTINKSRSDVVGVARKHMLLNTAVSAIAAYIWWSLKDSPNHVPKQIHVQLGWLAIVLLGISGHLGGKMAYQHGIGQRQIA